MKKRILFLSLVTAASLLFGCGQKVDGEASVQSVSMICGIGSTGLVDRFAGVVSPQSETVIKKDEEQTVSEVKVKAGDTVKKGQVLFTYDMEQTQLNLDKAQLELEQLNNSLDMQKKEISSLEKERASASKDQKLSYTLEIQEAQTAVLESNYNISTKKKEIQKLKETLKNLEVKSPVKGQVQTINEDGATDNMGNPLPYMTIVETGSYRVKGYVNETNASALSEGVSVLLRSRVDDSVWHGTIETIDWENPEQAGNNDSFYASENSDATTTSSKYPFYIKLDDDNGLILGQHVYIEPDYGQEAQEEEDSSLIQLPAVYLSDADSSAWVWAQNEKGLLEKRSVTVGEYNEEMDTYPVENGLSADDYIAFPDDTLQEGMTCVPYDASSFDGTNGMDGAEGMDGMNPVDGAEGMDGMDPVDGAEGMSGMDPVDGAEGMNGMDPMDGAEGMNGMDPVDGAEGIDGMDSPDGDADGGGVR